MISAGGAVTALAYAGVGTGMGAIGAAIISSRSGKGEARAHAADMISEAASNLAARQAETINRLTVQNEKMRKSILTLANVLDEVLPQLPLSKTEVTKLKRAISAAKMSM